jgi:hypothetical protein
VGFGNGVVVELFGAFDAFACAISHRYRLGGNEDRAQFAAFAGFRGSKRTPDAALLGPFIDAIVGTPEWKQLSGLRHLAAHSLAVSGSLRFTDEPRAQVFLEREGAESGEGTDALAALAHLIQWAGGPLRWLWYAGELWLEPEEHPLLGTVEDIDAHRHVHLLDMETQELLTRRSGR